MGVESVDAHFDVLALDNLIDLLVQIKERNGDVGADLLHNNSEFATLEEDLRMSAKYQSLRQLKPLRMSLRALLDVTDHHIRRLQNECTPFFHQKGIKSLPDDILRCVFEAGYESIHHLHGKEADQPSSRFSITLSSVSRHFRQVALGCPRIWICLSNAMGRDLLALYISRSKNVGLDILISHEIFREDMSFGVFMDIITQESQRWQIVVLDIDGNADQLSTLCQYRDLQIQRLSELHFFLFSPDERTSRDACSILETWHVPHLTHLSVLNCFIPKAAPWSQLHSCTLSFHPIIDENEGDKWDCYQILLDLHALRMLQSLTLDFYDADQSEIVDRLNTTSLTLQNLNSLIIILTSCDLANFMPSLFRGLRLPFLSELAVKLNADNSGEFAAESLLPGANPYPCLRVINLMLSTNGTMRLGSFQTKLPSLEHIYIEHFVGRVPPFDGIHPWHSVCFNECSLEDVDAEGIADMFMRGHKFQTLTLVGCRVAPSCVETLKSCMGSKLVVV
ncbi:hypothetical protein BD410DRAFT_53875 [Rickenella mellea]|uniref:F-box domain-containing protein n=1 Tax=Rickenella mellea TaxID=50990 RepID=A0A4R5XHL4_9AGAM|nr:hypothetical protein BD410DRAFT_53875 [Rickenella mellea]